MNKTIERITLTPEQSQKITTLAKTCKLDIGLEWYINNQIAKKFNRQQTQQSNELNFYIPEKWNYSMDI